MINSRNIKTYSELSKLKTFEERFDYLNLNGIVCEETFGFDRYLNQKFYNATEWRNVRNKVIALDHGCDLGCDGYEINYDKILIHHMNPITQEDIINKSKYLLDPEYLITTVKKTHDAIHYGNRKDLYPEPVERYKNDMCPWIH